MQLVGALVVQAQAALVTASISSMVLTRYYARIPFGDFELELSRARDSHYISITLHADEATGLLAQVWCDGTVGLATFVTLTVGAL